MKIDVEFFGLAILECWASQNAWAGKDVSDKQEGPAFKKYWYCYFVMDFGAGTTQPHLFWSMRYRTPGTIKKMRNICKNAGVALINRDKIHKCYSKFSNVEKMIMELKLKLFGTKDVPIRNLTIKEWERRYKKLDFCQNTVPHV